MEPSDTNLSPSGNIQEIVGLDVINFAIDKCTSAKALRLAATNLLTLQDLYILTGSIEDDVIDENTRLEIRANLHGTFSQGQLHLFADTMFSHARQAPSEYHMDYFYCLYEAASNLLGKEEYREFSKCYELFTNDNSEMATGIKQKIDDVQAQAEQIYQHQRKN